MQTCKLCAIYDQTERIVHYDSMANGDKVQARYNADGIRSQLTPTAISFAGRDLLQPCFNPLGLAAAGANVFTSITDHVWSLEEIAGLLP